MIVTPAPVVVLFVLVEAGPLAILDVTVGIVAVVVAILTGVPVVIVVVVLVVVAHPCLAAHEHRHDGSGGKKKQARAKLCCTHLELSSPLKDSERTRNGTGSRARLALS